MNSYPILGKLRRGMTKIAAVVFDLGGVLITFDYRIAMRNLLPNTNTTEQDAWRLLTQTTLLLDFETGKITVPEFYDAIRSATGYSGNFEMFRESFNSMFGYVPEMVQIHDEVRARGYRTYVLSNTNEMAVEYFREKFPFFNRFDGYVFSYDPAVRALKPAETIYARVEEISGLKGEQLIYLDDVPEFVHAARARGWRAVLHRSPPESRRTLVELGVLDRD